MKTQLSQGPRTTQSHPRGPYLSTPHQNRNRPFTKGEPTLTDVVIKSNQCPAEFCLVISAVLMMPSTTQNTFVAFHDDPYPRANTLVDEF